ncbi:PAS domain-containing sensor histidine kinase, partial [Stenotrophomonas maltophilia]|nr:PAS domain-containing sensor histidine kinase [Stenotrophomonas maltophilia]
MPYSASSCFDWYSWKFMRHRGNRNDRTQFLRAPAGRRHGPRRAHYCGRAGAGAQRSLYKTPDAGRFPRSFRQLHPGRGWPPVSAPGQMRDPGHFGGARPGALYCPLQTRRACPASGDAGQA